MCVSRREYGLEKKSSPLDRLGSPERKGVFCQRRLLGLEAGTLPILVAAVSGPFVFPIEPLSAQAMKRIFRDPRGRPMVSSCHAD